MVGLNSILLSLPSESKVDGLWIIIGRIVLNFHKARHTESNFFAVLGQPGEQLEPEAQVGRRHFMCSTR